jgi:pimeloyl-ACP methyl ester carboxylesterase
MTQPVVTKHYVATSRGELHVRRCGESGSVLVMLQILPFATAMLEPLMPLLAKAGLVCVAIDLMGYGRSDKRDGVWMVEDFAENINEGIDRLQLRPSFMLGGHFAGMVTALAASQRAIPIEKLVLDGTPVWPADYRANIAAEMGVKPFTVDATGQFMTDTWAQVMAMMSLLNPGFLPSAATATVLRTFAVQLLETTYGPSVVPAMAAFDMALLVPKIRIPTLILTSENDSQVKFFRTLVEGIAGARGHRFPGTHPMHDLDHPGRVTNYARTLTDFLLGEG